MCVALDTPPQKTNYKLASMRAIASTVHGGVGAVQWRRCPAAVTPVGRRASSWAHTPRACIAGAACGCDPTMRMTEWRYALAEATDCWYASACDHVRDRLAGLDDGTRLQTRHAVAQQVALGLSDARCKLHSARDVRSAPLNAWGVCGHGRTTVRRSEPGSSSDSLNSGSGSTNLQGNPSMDGCLFR